MVVDNPTPTDASRPLRIGTRASALARWQSDWVADELVKAGAEVEIVEITTRGDAQQQGSVSSLGVQGVFTKELQLALLDGRIDAAVHSLKDLPTAQIAGLTIGATPERADPVDALVAVNGDSFANLPEGAIVGTGSLRRQAQLLAVRPDLHVRGIRGNVDTRLRKLDEGRYDAIVLAAAGLQRLGLDARISDRLTPPAMLPAPGQGALAIECRENDQWTMRQVTALDDAQTRASTEAERTLLAALEGGCSAPIAAWGRCEAGQLFLDALVVSLDGSQQLRAADRGDPNAAAELGAAVAAELERAGARKIIAESRR